MHIEYDIVGFMELKQILKDFWFYTQTPLVHKTQRYKSFINQDELLRTNDTCKTQPYALQQQWYH